MQALYSEGPTVKSEYPDLDFYQSLQAALGIIPLIPSDTV
jgi:hypothetical protein